MSRSSAPHNQPRLFVEPKLAETQQIALSQAQSHYLSHVLRLKENGLVRLFNGRDGEWQAYLKPTKKNGITAIVNHQTRPQTPDSSLHLFCAPIKKAHVDTIIAKATELGVAEIHPILTSRTQVRDINNLHATAIAIEAAEQSERLSVPIIHPIVKLEKIISTWPKNLLPIICAETGEALPVHEAFETIGRNSSPLEGEVRACPGLDPGWGGERLGGVSAAIITGPEGGFTSEELNLLNSLPHAIPIRLGPRILRADTAALAALACWQAFCGDWR
jgi:16S rRNA (uracil1498-N3)-methyltransferase